MLITLTLHPSPVQVHSPLRQACCSTEVRSSLRASHALGRARPVHSSIPPFLVLLTLTPILPRPQVHTLRASPSLLAFETLDRGPAPSSLSASSESSELWSEAGPLSPLPFPPLICWYISQITGRARLHPLTLLSPLDPSSSRRVPAQPGATSRNPLPDLSESLDHSPFQVVATREPSPQGSSLGRARLHPPPPTHTLHNDMTPSPPV